MKSGGHGPNDIMVSVCMITYGHERFIAQAIESVLMQVTDFKVELVIGEDCSQVKTREIIEAYAAKHADAIRAFYRAKNLGMSRNFANT
ncbi:MAG: glycosyltransferase, partial [Chloroflexi bacterium]|nr:glycosyltransferase [Chloroflexota bacterium]